MNIKINKKNEGITLIALVVTIIVLLILAGISISMITGENGILGRARQARDMTKEAEEEENITMAYNTAVMDDLSNGTENFVENFKNELEKFYGEGNVEVTEKEDGSGYEVKLKDEGSYDVDEKTGKVTKKVDAKYIPEATYIIAKDANSEEDINGKGTLEKQEGTKFYVIVTAKVKEGEISSVEAETGLTKDNGASSAGKYVFSATDEKEYTVTITSNKGKDYEQKITLKVRAHDIYKVANMPGNWELADSSNTDNEWYAYTRINDGSSSEKIEEVNKPILKGKMHAIKYSKELSNITSVGNYTSRWANAMTSDGSMWVWIPRYAYKITEGYHQTATNGGTIDIVFVDENNEPLGTSSEGNTVTKDDITENTTEENVGQSSGKYLVHPAFTSNADAGGGFGEDGKGITGFWFAKFETTPKAEEDRTNENFVMESKPGIASLRNKTIGQFYDNALKQTYGEETTGETSFCESHMVKNSEWGAVAYLSESKFGTNKQSVARNTNSNYYTGGTSTVASIYETSTYYNQSTTRNAYGVYDMSGGAYERVAAYLANDTGNLTTNGGTMTNKENGEDKSTKYKTVYKKGVTDTQSNNYEAAKEMKGDAVYETSSTYSSSSGSWHSACAYFPYTSSPFFARGGGYVSSYAGVFYFLNSTGVANDYYSCRLALAP